MPTLAPTARGLFALALLCAAPAAAGNGLEDWVSRADASSRWEVRSERRKSGVDEIRVELVSQTWQGEPWTHEIRVLRPESPARPDVALLVVTGGGDTWLDDEAELAKSAGVTVAVLDDVPNQPLFGLREDDLIAYTFDRWLKTADPSWPLLFPMTKSATEAMDAVAELGEKRFGRRVERFVVSGASKRGWTSWLAAAVDPRVVGIVSLVFDNLNFGPQMKNQIATWGRYSEQLGDYTERGLQALIDTPRGRELVAMIDPWAYRERLARTAKLIVNATNDRYWTLDALSFYYPELPGPKNVLWVPNEGHGFSDERVDRAMTAFVRRVADGRAMPELRMRDDPGPRIVVESDEEPVAMRLWTARSDTRDFRDARWREGSVTRTARGFGAALTRPEGGFAAAFGEAEYREGDLVFPLSTRVRIVPSPAAAAPASGAR